MTDTWEGQLQPLTDPSSLTINQFVMVLLIALIEQMNNVCDVIKDCSYLHCHPKVRPSMADVMPTEELGSAVMLTEELSVGCPLGYFQEVTTWSEVYSYRCSPG